ncbi:MAG: double zinc ribbon domain-containing protein, partial [Gaiellaceae bacterium]
MGIADLLLPDRCAVCGCDARGLCGECRESLVALRPPLCAL